MSTNWKEVVFMSMIAFLCKLMQFISWDICVRVLYQSFVRLVHLIQSFDLFSFTLWRERQVCVDISIVASRDQLHRHGQLSEYHFYNSMTCLEASLAGRWRPQLLHFHFSLRRQRNRWWLSEWELRRFVLPWNCLSTANSLRCHHMQLSKCVDSPIPNKIRGISL